MNSRSLKRLNELIDAVHQAGVNEGLGDYLNNNAKMDQNDREISEEAKANLLKYIKRVMRNKAANEK